MINYTTVVAGILPRSSEKGGDSFRGLAAGLGAKKNSGGLATTGGFFSAAVEKILR